ncbi:Hdr-like menaquinol oxidoreductase iron-sulfur subunit [Bienertia sinuspersici]
MKSHVSNKVQPEGSIAEGYLLWEIIAFCSRYLKSVETIFNRPRRNEEGVSNLDRYLFNSGGRVVGKKENVRLDDRSLKQVHRYVLLHSDELTPVLE